MADRQEVGQVKVAGLLLLAVLATGCDSQRDFEEFREQCWRDKLRTEVIHGDGIGRPIVRVDCFDYETNEWVRSKS